MDNYKEAAEGDQSEVILDLESETAPAPETTESSVKRGDRRDIPPDPSSAVSAPSPMFVSSKGIRVCPDSRTTDLVRECGPSLASQLLDDSTITGPGPSGFQIIKHQIGETNVFPLITLSQHYQPLWLGRQNGLGKRKLHARQY